MGISVSRQTLKRKHNIIRQTTSRWLTWCQPTCLRCLCSRSFTARLSSSANSTISLCRRWITWSHQQVTWPCQRVHAQERVYLLCFHWRWITWSHQQVTWPGQKVHHRKGFTYFDATGDGSHDLIKMTLSEGPPQERVYLQCCHWRWITWTHQQADSHISLSTTLLWFSKLATQL